MIQLLLFLPAAALGYLLVHLRSKPQVKIQYRYKFTVYIPPGGKKKTPGLKYTE